MQTVKNKEILTAQWDKLAEILNSEEFNLQGARERPGVVSAEYHPKEDTGDKLLYEIRTVEYRRSKTGMLDKNKTESSRTEYTWDAQKRTLAWEYFSPPSTKKVRTSGVYTLNPISQGTELVHVVSVEVNLPLVGNQFAKLIAKEFDKAFPGTISKLKRHLD